MVTNGFSSSVGGGIGNVNGTLVLNQCTLSGNSATDGGAIYQLRWHRRRWINAPYLEIVLLRVVGGVIKDHRRRRHFKLLWHTDAGSMHPVCN